MLYRRLRQLALQLLDRSQIQRREGGEPAQCASGLGGLRALLRALRTSASICLLLGRGAPGLDHGRSSGVTRLLRELMPKAQQEKAQQARPREVRPRQDEPPPAQCCARQRRAFPRHNVHDCHDRREDQVLQQDPLDGLNILDKLGQVQRGQGGLEGRGRSQQVAADLRLQRNIQQQLQLQAPGVLLLLGGAGGVRVLHARAAFCRRVLHLVLVLLQPIAKRGPCFGGVGRQFEPSDDCLVPGHRPQGDLQEPAASLIRQRALLPEDGVVVHHLDAQVGPRVGHLDEEALVPEGVALALPLDLGLPERLLGVVDPQAHIGIEGPSKPEGVGVDAADVHAD
mmetsp:Transcript_104713/g.301372  ORF Transcript_104713/g.301372 Transcript_104713/m.301372 type:complete len:340 (+) Transcript_104713:512-1531(+)